MFGGVLNLATSDSFETDGTYGDKTDTYKLALYWATNRRMWSLSRNIEMTITMDDDVQGNLPVTVCYLGTYRYWDLPPRTIGISRNIVGLEN